MAYLAFGLRTSGETASDAGRANAVKGAAVAAAPGSLSIRERAIKTTQVGRAPTYAYSQAKPGKTAEPPKVVARVATTSIYVTISDLSRVGKVIDAVVKAGADTTNGLTFARRRPAARPEP